MSSPLIVVARVRDLAGFDDLETLEDAVADCLHHHLRLTVEKVSVQKPVAVAVAPEALPRVTVHGK